MKSLMLIVGFGALVLTSGCYVEHRPAHRGAYYGEFRGEYPATTYGYTEYRYRGGYRHPYDRDRYFNRDGYYHWHDYR